MNHRVNSCGGMEKRARVELLCRVSFDAARQVHLLPVKGVAQAVKAKGSRTRAVLKKSELVIEFLKGLVVTYMGVFVGLMAH